MAPRTLRAAIVGASTVWGRELAEQLNEAAAVMWDITLLDEEESIGQMTVAGDEPLVIQPLTPGAFERMDVVFFATDAATVRTHWKEAQAGGAGVVDMTGTLAVEAGAAVLAPGVSAAAVDLTTTVVVAAHPAAVMLALAAVRLKKRFGIAKLVATLMEPASEQGKAGLDELHQQTVGLLSFGAVPKAVYDTQIAFNLTAGFGVDAKASLASTAARICTDFGEIAVGCELALQVVQAPVFNGYAASVFVGLAEATEQEVREAMDGGVVEIVAETDESPSNLRALSQKRMLVSVRADGGGFWLWMATDHGSIQFLLAKHGGIAPAVRRWSERTLTLAEREEISRGIASGSSIREIAKGLQRAASTVSREVARHGGRPVYRASEADQQAWKLALRPKLCLLARHRKLRMIVANKLILNWSPEQISGWLKRRYSSNESMRVSNETIYRSLFIQARGVLKKELMQHLRSRRQIRRSVHAKAAGQSRGQIVDAISIRERPAEVEDRAIPGHWEGDLLSGSGNSHIATLVERHSRFAILVKVSSKDTATVVDALTRQVRRLPATLRRSLTWDRGLEMAKHKSFTVATKVNVYFCDPQSPWQRGTNENTNGLLRQYFPRKTDLSGYSQADLDKVALRLNQRPRKTLNFETPASKLHASVASTG